MSIDQYHLGLMSDRLIFRQHREGGDDHDVAFFGQMGGGAVDADGPGAAGAGQGIGLEAVPVGDVPDVDMFVGQDVRSFQEVDVDRDTALIMQVGVGDRRPMDLRFE